MGCLVHNLTFILVLISFVCFFLVVFGALSLELFGGKMQGRCVVNTTQEVVLPPQYCAEGGYRPCGVALGHVCNLHFGNAYNGHASFDNIFAVFLVIFQIASLASWDMYVSVLEDISHPTAALLPVAVIVCISLICFNLFIAVISYRWVNATFHCASPCALSTDNLHDES